MCVRYVGYVKVDRGLLIDNKFHNFDADGNIANMCHL